MATRSHCHYPRADCMSRMYRGPRRFTQYVPSSVTAFDQYTLRGHLSSQNKYADRWRMLCFTSCCVLCTMIAEFGKTPVLLSITAHGTPCCLMTCHQEEE